MIIAVSIFLGLIVLVVAIALRATVTLGPKYPCYNRRCLGIWELHELINGNCPECGKAVKWR